LVNLIFAGLDQPEGGHRRTVFRRELPHSDFARSGRSRERQHDIEGAPYRGVLAWRPCVSSSLPRSGVARFGHGARCRAVKGRRRRGDGRSGPL